MENSGENFVVSARKYRPGSFESVIGQEAITQTLKNTVATKKIGQAYLFCGPRGVGKTTCARIFAKTINCMDPKENGEACDECESCKAFNHQRSMNIFELDAASKNGTNDIKEITAQTLIPPRLGKYSVYIIDEVHMLSTQAFNAFLKTLEEPPSYVVFILATTEKYKILPTILSRCQTYDFNRIPIPDIIKQLSLVGDNEDIKYEKEALHVIAEKADGGMRDALSIFDQIASFTERNITYDQTIKNLNVIDYEVFFQITDTFLKGDFPEALNIFNDVLNKGFESVYFINGLASHYRNILICREQNTVNLLQVGERAKELYMKYARLCSVRFLFNAIGILSGCDMSYKQSQNKRLLVELALMKICDIETGVMSKGNQISTVQQIQLVVQSTVQPINNQTVQVVNNQTVTKTAVINNSIATKKDDGVPMVSINELMGSVGIEPKTKRTCLFDTKKLEYEWDKYCESNDLGNVKLNAYLRNHTPKRINDIKYKIEEDDPKIRERFKIFVDKIQIFFRNCLQNDDFELIMCAKEEFQSEIKKRENIIQDVENQSDGTEIDDEIIVINDENGQEAENSVQDAEVEKITNKINQNQEEIAEEMQKDNPHLKILLESTNISLNE